MQRQAVSTHPRFHIVTGLDCLIPLRRRGVACLALYKQGGRVANTNRNDTGGEFAPNLGELVMVVGDSLAPSAAAIGTNTRKYPSPHVSFHFAIQWSADSQITKRCPAILDVERPSRLDLGELHGYVLTPGVAFVRRQMTRLCTSADFCLPVPFSLDSAGQKVGGLLADRGVSICPDLGS